MKLSDLDYSYPAELVADYPLEQRDQSRMMVLRRDSKTIEHHYFKEIVDFFNEGELLILNDSKVFPCRLIGQKKSGGRVECFLIKEKKAGLWDCLLKSSKKIFSGQEVTFSDDLKGTVLNEDSYLREISLSSSQDIPSLIDKEGHIPLPPYIKREENKTFDLNRYQTVYASKRGSVAAPTAGFHFTKSVLSQLQEKGVRILKITLHVGLGTFTPVRSENLEQHQMHEEVYEISSEVAEEINEALQEKRSITAVGTTVVRALESAFKKDRIESGLHSTQKFIYPPYSFQVISRLLTNFHQPKTTLLALVMAFAETFYPGEGQNLIHQSYKKAIQEKYRLFSYGDCMFLV